MPEAPPVAPLVALALFAAGALVLALIGWPRVGLVARIVRRRRLTAQVLHEDALKQLHHAEEAGGAATVDSLAGALAVERGVAARLVEGLVERGVARLEEGRLTLTPGGLADARRLVRTHRLWERYLADRSGLHPSEWHDEAELAEHRLTAAQAEALSAAMGHPRYDPHGDPIPTAGGDLPAPTGRRLSGHPAGTALMVVHLEDEPREFFLRLLDLGLRPGARLRLLAVTSGEVRFRMDGVEQTLPRVVADQITAEPLPGGDELDERRYRTLADLPHGASARVVRLSSSCQGPERRRLLDLGVVPGTRVTARFGSVGGDPVAYSVRGALLALRRVQAAAIQVELDPERPA